MKAKFNIGEGGIKGLLVLHAEKMLFAVAIFLTVLLIWSGFQRRSVLEANRSASALNQKVSTVKNQIDQFTWETTFKTSRDMEQRYGERAKETLKKVAVANFTMPQMLSPPPLPPRSRRIDPEIFPAFDLHAISGYGAYQKPQEIDSMGRARMPARDRRRAEATELMFGQFDEEEGMRPLPPDHPASRGDSRSGFGGSLMEVGGTDVETKFFVSVTALVPVKQQFDQYMVCFSKTTKDYNAERDRPKYISWVLQRATVDDFATEPEWEEIAKYSRKNSGMEQGLAGGMGGGMGGMGDEVDPGFLHPVLSQPVIGLLLRNIDAYARHPNVPRATKFDFYGEQEGEFGNEDGAIAGEIEDDLPGIDVGGFGFRGGFGQNPYGEGLEEFGGGKGGEMSYEMAGGGFGPGMMGGQGQGRLAEYFMFRYIDLDVEPGAGYRYRVQLWIEDPNQPRPGTSAPSASSLDTKVKDRLASQPKVGKKKIIPKFWRETEWSEPSQIVWVSLGRKLLTGETKPTRPIALRDRNISFHRAGDEPKAEMMLLQWDEEYNANVPGEQTLKLGSVPLFMKDAEVLIGSNLKKLEDYRFSSGYVVLDIEGGAAMGIHDLTVPGEVLVWDNNGDFQVLDELENADEYALHHYEPARGRLGFGEDEFGGLGGEDLLEGETGKGGRRSRRGGGK